MVILLFVVHPIAEKIGKAAEERGAGKAAAELLSSRERFEAALLAACLLLEEICTLSPFPPQMRFIFPVIVGKVLLAFLIAVCVCVFSFIH